MTMTMHTAALIAERLRANGFPADDAVERNVLCLAEETGEFIGAYRRWSGRARRSGTAADMHAELADVVITAYGTAAELGFDLDAAITAKLAVVFSRGWREPATPADVAPHTVLCGWGCGFLAGSEAELDEHETDCDLGEHETGDTLGEHKTDCDHGQPATRAAGPAPAPGTPAPRPAARPQPRG
jgi:hypothetical protein